MKTMKSVLRHITHPTPVLLSLILAGLGTTTAWTAERYVSLTGGHVAPFTDWASAATNIQDAIDVSSDGDVVWVTNGVYNTGGRTAVGSLQTNRITLDKALTVRSVNGPFVTAIQGSGELLPRPELVRCAWLTNGAVLSGFTLQYGATFQDGGGAFCLSNAVVESCVIKNNRALRYSPAVEGGQLRNCWVTQNDASQRIGSVSRAILNQCTVFNNGAGGINNCRITNCIVYSNSIMNIFGDSRVAYSCVTPPRSSAGNISSNPELLPDGLHLAESSPCRGAGINLGFGTDLDGQAWANPPSMGCVEWSAKLIIAEQPAFEFIAATAQFKVRATVAGETPITYRWMRNGVELEDDGQYEGVHSNSLLTQDWQSLLGAQLQLVASNALGSITSAVVQLPVHYAAMASSTPMAPYTSWDTAATNIQDAIDAAAPGSLILVTNGVYNTGGRTAAGPPPFAFLLTNRVTVDKAILVQSVNGAETTIIEGYWQPGTINGPLAVRCAWLTNGATLRGFTLRGGATLSVGPDVGTIGGGVFCTSSNDTFVLDCIISGNAAFGGGSGAYSGFLNRCVIAQNTVQSSSPMSWGAVQRAVLNNCLITENQCGGISVSRATNCVIIRNTSRATSAQAAVVNSTLHQCTVTFNTGGGVTGGSAVNSIIWNNWNSLIQGNRIIRNFLGTLPVMSFCCAYPMPSGTGNIADDPQLLDDGIHLAATSPCRGAGDPTQVIGTDWDGQPWANPPAIGCDEWQPEPLIGQLRPRPSTRNGQVRLSALAIGAAPFTATWSKDGVVLTSGNKYSATDSPDLLINVFDPTDAGAYQVVLSNAAGMSTSMVAQVTVHCVDVAGANPQPPYLDWSTAATNIQAAVDAAQAGAVILVTNGIYNSGQRLVANNLGSNRLVVDRAVLVSSVNGPEVTYIEGTREPLPTGNAPRCVWLAHDAAGLSGLTLRDGKTGWECGGGIVFCEALLAELGNCVITNGYSSEQGGGVFGGRLDHCTVVGNVSFGGGGVVHSQLHNCLIKNNLSYHLGGGAFQSELINCTIINNSSTLSFGGGIANSKAVNSIIYFNQTVGINNDTTDNVHASEVSYSCTTPLLPGPGNIADDPQLVDGFHLAATSPCRGAGLASATSGFDLDGDLWSNPPSMGCDEVVEAAFVGPLTVTLTTTHPQIAAAIPQLLTGEINGRAARIEWSFGDGVIATNLSYQTWYAWTTPGTYTVTLTAYNGDHPNGVSAQATVEVQPWLPPQLGVGGLHNGKYTLSFTSQIGLTYVVEQTTNLTPPIAWQPVQTIPGTGGLIQLTNSSVTGPMRFYRVRTE